MTESKVGARARLDSAITERITFQGWSVSKPRLELQRWLDADSRRLVVALALAGLFAVVGLMTLATAVSRPAARPSSPAALAQQHPVLALRAEAAPADAGKAWSVVKVWQGSAVTETDEFTAGEHWRVDWLFNPGQAGGVLQIYIYSADGRLLLDLAANTDKAGANTSFWTGPGRYFLKVKSAGGDWKIDVQDLR